MPANPPISTIVTTLRTDHGTLATLLLHYTNQGIKITSTATLLRYALADFAAALVKNDLSREFNLEEALDYTQSINFQQSHAKQLHTRRAVNLSNLRGDEIDQAAKEFAEPAPLAAPPEPEGTGLTPADVNSIVNDFHSGPDLGGIITKTPKG